MPYTLNDDEIQELWLRYGAGESPAWQAVWRWWRTRHGSSPSCIAGNLPDENKQRMTNDDHDPDTDADAADRADDAGGVERPRSRRDPGHESTQLLPRRGGRAIPNIRVGRRIMIPTARLLSQLGLPLDDITWDSQPPTTVQRPEVGPVIAS